jgi:DNA-binding beta-propeller fold protein YncE
VASNTVGTDLPMPGLPIEIQIAPNGKMAYVAVAGNVDDVVPLDLTVSPATAGTPIVLPKGTQPHWIAFTPDGSTAYVVGNGNSTLTAITVASNTAGTPIKVSTDPNADILAPIIVPSLG